MMDEPSFEEAFIQELILVCLYLILVKLPLSIDQLFAISSCCIRLRAFNIDGLARHGCMKDASIVTRFVLTYFI
jgi:hypothetical protein